MHSQAFKQRLSHIASPNDKIINLLIFFSMLRLFLYCHNLIIIIFYSFKMFMFNITTKLKHTNSVSRVISLFVCSHICPNTSLCSVFFIYKNIYILYVVLIDMKA